MTNWPPFVVDLKLLNLSSKGANNKKLLTLI